MRLSSTLSLAVLALPILLHSPGALSAEPSKDTAPSCGASSREAIAFAEKAWAEKSAEGRDRAFACLLAAVKELEAARLDAIDNKDRTRVLNVPRTP
jgi:hypothetical protein